MNDIVGYAEIKHDAKTCKGARNPSDFIGKICRVMEFGHDGCVMVLNSQGNALAMFDSCDVYRSFKCKIFNDVITPPNMDFIEQIMYHDKVMTRKGGYNNIVKNFVIASSLHKGEFNDHVLWAKQ